jgi:general secretion pathway protein J
MGMRRVVADFEAAYFSQNDDPNLAITNPRTMFVARAGDKVPDIRFSTLGHRPLWADANESEQTVISYTTRSNPDRNGGTDWVRREQRRLSNENPETVPAEYDVLITNVEKVEIEYWNWKNAEWQDAWDTTQADGQKNTLPTRVKITITLKDAAGQDEVITSQARIAMTEPLNFVQ